MQKPSLFFFLFFLSGFLFSQSYVPYVNPLIGTGGHGHTYPGATLPHGMVQLSPDTRIDGSWDGCSGYHYSDNRIYGFSHTHLSGTGVSDYGDIMLMPVTKKKTAFLPEEYASYFDHSSEIATAGFYSVKLNDANVTANLTTTLRTGFHQYIFHENENAMMVLDLTHRDELLDGKIEVINNHTISGYRFSKSWAKNQKIFYYIEFSRDFKDVSGFFSEDNEIISNCVNFLFDLKKNDTLLVKVGISGTSEFAAKNNLQMENPGWNFDNIRERAVKTWNDELGKIEVTCENKSDYEVFYTALYHTMIVPNIWSDANGMFRGMDDMVHIQTGADFYSVFSLWDTFRAAHPLYTLIDRRRTEDYVETFIQQFQDGGRLPVWELSANETECMIGIHSISVIADAVTKGLVDDQYKEVLYQAMVATSQMNLYRGIGMMNNLNYLTIEKESESASKTLEYCYQYHCMAIITRWAGKEASANEFESVSLGYKNLFNQDTGFFAPRSNGAWLTNFDPTEVNNHYTEANAWQYTFFVPHDIKGMIDLYGGKEKFHAKLDSLFGTSSKMTGREQADITGLIGQYAHGNEPSHHVAYLYNYVGDFKSTSRIVSKICDEFYTPLPDGLSGNEDCGQMSAWYVLSALGLYQVNPGSPYFTFSTPKVLSAKMNLENGKTISIKRDGGEINQIKWNGVKLDRLYISYDELMKGGELSFEHGETNEISEGDILNTSSVANSSEYLRAPIIIAKNPIFEKQTMVTIISGKPSQPVYCRIIPKTNSNGKLGKVIDKEYKKPFKVKNNCTVVAYYKGEHGIPLLTTAYSILHKLPNNYDIDIKSLVHPQYFPGGERGLLDGVNGDVDWRKGNWHGYQGVDFVAVVDTKKPTRNTKITCSFLEDTGPWIYFPDSVFLYVSTDNINFQLRESHKVPVERLDLYADHTGLSEVIFDLIGLGSYRYFKIVAKNFGSLPKGHPSEGNPSYIFIDEIKFE